MRVRLNVPGEPPLTLRRLGGHAVDDNRDHHVEHRAEQESANHPRGATGVERLLHEVECERRYKDPAAEGQDAGDDAPWRRGEEPDQDTDDERGAGDDAEDQGLKHDPASLRGGTRLSGVREES